VASIVQFEDGVYEGATQFDDLYTRVVDALIEVDRVNYILDPTTTFRRCELQARAAFVLIQQHVAEASEASDIEDLLGITYDES